MMAPLANSVHGATVGSDLVFLDVARDAYVCLAGAAEAGRLCGDHAQIETDDGDLIAALHEAGLTGAVAVPRPMAPRANRSLRRHSGAVAALDILAGVPMTWGPSVARRYHGPFDQLIGWAQRRPLGAADRNAEPCERAVAVVHCFQRRWPWALGRGLCLHRAQLLLAMLRRAECDAWWVFGVRTYPFEAHCWLQIGATVLDDSLTRLAAYEPLMSV